MEQLLERDFLCGDISSVHTWLTKAAELGESSQQGPTVAVLSGK